MADFLLELRCEEIPARMQAGARAELEKLFRRELDAAGVSAGELTVWSTPRRLALIARGLPLATAAVSEEAKGPPEGAPDPAIDGFCKKNGVTRDQLELRDVKGRMTYFAVIERAGQPIEDVLAVRIPLIVYGFNWPKSMRWGEESISTESLRWVRPLSGMVAMLDDRPLPISLDGVNVYQDSAKDLHFRAMKTGIVASNLTFGHRFHSTGEIEIQSVSSYSDQLRTAHVIVDHEERAALIRDGAAKVAAEAGLTLVADEGLVIENAGLTEWPVPLLGRFDEAFLDVPPEVIQLTARVNQKYFVCEDPQGKLANAFICTANIAATDPAVVVDGNRKVLAARLSDARFFWEQDQKTPLAVHAEKLARITFHEKLGTVADKVERVAKLARWLCEEGIVRPTSVRPEPVEGPSFTSEGKYGASTSSARMVDELADLAEQAARLCKADLVTEMVGEFPELQGLMGGYYAAKEGLPQEVSDAIRDHYKPVGQGDDVPTAPVTVAVSLADKLDTLVGFFAISEKPTGSKDPFALRRAAIGVCDICLSLGLRLPLRKVVSEIFLTLRRKAVSRELTVRYDEDDNMHRVIWQHSPCEPEWEIAVLAESPSSTVIDEDNDYFDGNVFNIANHLRYVLPSTSAVVDDVIRFFADRLKVQQREAGVRHDLIDAVFALGGEDDLVRLLARVHALQAFVTTEDGTNLLAGYKRAANILKKEGWDTPSRLPGLDPGPRSLSEEAEEAGSRLGGRDDDIAQLAYTPEPAEKALIDALDAAAPRAAQAVEAEQFADAMAALATLRAPIDRFFDEVTVNAEEAEKRSSRLALLARFRDAVHRVADFSRIEG